jgi:virginiamycin B lyase
MRPAIVILLAWFLGAAVPAAASQDPPIELGQGTKAQALTFAPDGNLWFAANKYGYGGFTNVVGRVTPENEIREFSLPDRKRIGVSGITPGPDGYLWFADTARDAIGRSSLSGQVEEFPLLEGAAPHGIVIGPDGAMWFAETGSGRLGRIDASGSIATFMLPIGSHPLDLAVAGGALWVTENGRNAIARVQPDGDVTEYSLPHPDSKPKAIVRGAGDELWFSEEAGSRLGHIGQDGVITEFDVPGNVGGTGALAAGLDGTIFFVTGNGRAFVEVGSLSPSGELTGLACVTVTCDLPVSALTVAPDGSLWYATDVAYYGGGGGGALLQPYVPGTVGRFEPPDPVAISISRRLPRLRGHFLRVGIACRSRSGVRCIGNVSLEARGPWPGGRHEKLAISRKSYFWLGSGRNRRISLQIVPFAMDVLRRRAMRVTLRTVVHGGSERSRRFTLRPPRPH